MDSKQPEPPLPELRRALATPRGCPLSLRLFSYNAIAARVFKRVSATTRRVQLAMDAADSMSVEDANHRGVFPIRHKQRSFLGTLRWRNGHAR
jgi:hypothetical protein